ncbi:selenocysteine-specific translation elongation factor [Stutzerimonas degradans]|uniref:Selenocysteine-specific elongation factor n=1 Tax=Stutzerimonas degradans TaxID=2968968 RepID=A0A8E2QED9_9GAMM|nr:selenocysteine-specific translation elongation factor [Stutzerimonas degradans]MCQ4276496.1 selenocysteine-specific translation elongation factor [Stutzerimonas degradans]PNF75936.1 selenocysteine-specific translation elongation factor [Stutzerimonas degradans]QPT20760.1 selenocysteine-specific translation elongation factor [Stutzerimonas degradans]
MIVGTAGHIDHGKTALLKALTGQQGDRRREERERGITIDLGYAYADLGEGTLTGFIDVPGHERFIHNMLAGASGVDCLLLVVAADDGVMPQTREHLAIVELLGIRRALVALTKIDRVEPERIATVRRQIDDLLASGPLAGAPVFPVSSVSGDGVDALRQALVAEAARAEARGTDGHFRLAIDRAFSVSGTGVVVTGTAFAGRVQVGDELQLSPSGRSVRVRGLHAQNREAGQAHAGQRVALNLAGERLAVEQIHRGDWLLQPLLHAPTQRIDIQFQLLPGETHELKHWTPVHAHLGAQDVTARIALLEGESLAPGAWMFAQLLLNAPIHAVHGDRIVLRDQSAQRTLGGGRVLDPFAPPRNRRREARLAQLRALDAASLEQALPGLLAEAHNGLEPQALERQFNRPRDGWQLPASAVQIATRQGPRLFDQQRWQTLGTQLLAALQRFHEEQPDELGPDRDRLRRFALPQLERPVFIALLEQALAAGEIASSGPWLHRPDHQVRLTAQEEALKARLWPLLEAGRFDPPWVRDLASTLGAEEMQTRQLLRKLARLGLLQQVVKDLFYPEPTIRQLAGHALQLEAQSGVIRAAAFRDQIQLGRKRSIQLLEHFDRIGFTRRFGNERKIRHDNALATDAPLG